MTNAEVKMMLESHFTATRGMIMAMDDGINRRFDSIDTDNRVRNHRLEKAEKRLYDLEKEDVIIKGLHESCPANKVAAKFEKRWFWIAVAVLFALSYFILETLYNGTGLGEIILKHI